MRLPPSWTLVSRSAGESQWKSVAARSRAVPLEELAQRPALLALPAVWLRPVRPLLRLLPKQTAQWRFRRYQACDDWRASDDTNARPRLESIGRLVRHPAETSRRPGPCSR